MDGQEQPLAGTVPTVEVACGNSGCSRHGVRTWVRLQPAAIGFAVMPVLICTRCGQHAAIVRPWLPGGVPIVAAASDAPAVAAPARRPGRPKKVRA